jgi:hypothetical protein
MNKKRTQKNKKRSGGFGRNREHYGVVEIALTCHSGEQIEGDDAEFTVPADFRINFFVPRGTCGTSYSETELRMCVKDPPPVETFDSGTLCSNYNLSNGMDEPGGVYQCQNITFFDRGEPIFYIPSDGITLENLIKEIRAMYQSHNIDANIVLNCFFCRGNSGGASKKKKSKSRKINIKKQYK